ncbi:efflux RND transporter periplasmic adaptor subunit [Cohnella sp. GCM10027633]|uniref:efflux RND transporter periplasmic adaptor subunit n=1 Tax=unclassified Cohnella TaxID=2636738 RepID=UPI003640190B
MDKLSRTIKQAAALSLALCVSAALAGCSLLPKEEESLKPPLVKPAKENYTTVKAEKGTVVKTVGGSATFESYASEIAQFTGQGGRIESINVKAGDAVKKGDVLVQLILDGLDLQLKEAELGLEKAKMNFQQARTGDEQTIKIAGLQLEIEQIKYDRLKKQFNSKQLIATMDGEVTYADTLQEGDFIDAYQTLVIISDPTRLRLSLPVDNASDRAEVKVGVAAEVTVNKEQFAGKVVQTPSSAPTTENKQLAERYARTIYLEMPELPPNVEIGKLADVKIITQERKDVVKIQKSGLRSYLGRNFVRIMEEGNKLREVDVEPGLATSTEVEIVKGLEEGQEIVLQ